MREKRELYFEKLNNLIGEDLELLSHHAKKHYTESFDFEFEIEKILRSADTIAQVIAEVRKRYSNLDKFARFIAVRVAGNIAQVKYPELFERESEVVKAEDLSPTELTFIDATGQKVDLLPLIYKFNDDEESTLVINRKKRVKKQYDSTVEKLTKEIIDESKLDNWSGVRDKIYILKGLYARLTKAEQEKNIENWIEIERDLIDLSRT